MQITFVAPDWRWLRRLTEKLHPGIDGQVERWGRVSREKSWLGGVVTLTTSVGPVCAGCDGRCGVTPERCPYYNQPPRS